MRVELATLNHCAALFLSRAAANLCWYNSITIDAPDLVTTISHDKFFIKTIITKRIIINTNISDISMYIVINTASALPWVGERKFDSRKQSV